MAHPKASPGLCFPWGSGVGEKEGRKWVQKGTGLCWQDWEAFKTLPHIFIMDFSFCLLLQNLFKQSNGAVA